MPAWRGWHLLAQADRAVWASSTRAWPGAALMGLAWSDERAAERGRSIAARLTDNSEGD